MSDMYGKGIRPRFAMATEGLGKPSPYGGGPGRPHPDMTARTGAGPHMADEERAIGGPIQHAKGHLPAQAAPNHGPHHERELGFNRDGKV